MRGRLLVVTLLALACGVTPVHGAAPSRRGTLAGVTTLSWSGAAAIRLAVPRKTGFAGDDMDLVVTGASYAFVRLLGPASPDCPAVVGPRCAQGRVSWVRGVHDTARYAHLPPARRHDRLLGVPPGLDPPYVDVHLFTDGRATLTIRATSLRGRATYRPAPATRARVHRVEPACPLTSCVGEIHGGAVHDLAGPGWAEVWAYHGHQPDTTNQVHTLATCLYPNNAHPEASPRPEDHALGCDESSGAGSALDSLAQTAAETVQTTGAYVGVTRNVFWSGARGRQYVGYQGFASGPAPSTVHAFGIWFGYLQPD